MKISRRKVVVLGASAVSASLLPINLLAQSDGQSAEDIIKEFTGGANIGSGDIMLTTPEIAENGNTVPISVESKKATAIKILALGNPGPDVVTFKLSTLINLSGEKEQTLTSPKLRNAEKGVFVLFLKLR